MSEKVDRDEDFEAFLRRRSMLPGHGGPAAADHEPPGDLDDIVLRKARQAITQPPQMPLYKAPRWALPVALAATILLTFSILLNVSLNTRRNAAASRNSPAAPAAALTKRAPAPIPPPPAAEPARESQLAAATVTTAQAAKSAAPMAKSREDNAARASESAGATRDPQVWLKHINALRAAGHEVQADAELRRFRAAFPDYSVPPASEPTK